MKSFDELNYYELLEIHFDATSLEIRRAYRNAVTIYSEDSLLTYSLLSDDDREKILQKIEDAYLTLKDENKKTLYDKTLRNETGVPEIEEWKELSVPDIDLSKSCIKSQTDTTGSEEKAIWPTDEGPSAIAIHLRQRTLDEALNGGVSISTEGSTGRPTFFKRTRSSDNLSSVWFAIGTAMFVALVVFSILAYTRLAQNIYYHKSDLSQHGSSSGAKVVSDTPITHNSEPESGREREAYEKKVNASNEPDPTNISHPGIYVNLASVANIRSRPNITSEVVHRLQRGKKLDVIEKEGDWLKVKLQDGSFGWIYHSLVERRKTSTRSSINRH